MYCEWSYSERALVDAGYVNSIFAQEGLQECNKPGAKMASLRTSPPS